MRARDLPRGSVVLVAFPFTDLTATKVRPAVVLSTPEVHGRRVVHGGDYPFGTRVPANATP